jgi:hypothetical protein
MIVSFTKTSGNSKTGPMPVTMTEQRSCPSVCPFKDNKLCYPYFSPLGFIWESLDTNGFYSGLKTRRSTPISWDELCEKISKLSKNQIWRHNTAGDLPGENNKIDLKKLQQLVNSNKESKAMGYTYTHKPVGYNGQELINATSIYAANKNGFRINLSANSLEDADRLLDLNIAPVVVVIPTDSPKKMKTPKGRFIIACPAESGKIQCNKCKLCAKNRKSIIGFHAHGTKKKQVNKLLKVL